MIAGISVASDSSHNHWGNTVRKNIAILVLAAVAALGLTTTGAVAGIGLGKATVGSWHIKDGTIKSKDIKDGKVKSPDIKDGGIKPHDLHPAVRDNINQPGTRGVQVATLEAPVTITDIGGPINDNNTDTGVSLTLPAGEYLVTVDGAFMSGAAASDPDVEIHPQLSLWLDHDGDGGFMWQNGEGDISPNALMPTAADRHISVSGSTVVSLAKETDIGLLAFGYAEDQSSKRSGEIDVIAATLTATPLH